MNGLSSIRDVSWSQAMSRQPPCSGESRTCSQMAALNKPPNFQGRRCGLWRKWGRNIYLRQLMQTAQFGGLWKQPRLAQMLRPRSSNWSRSLGKFWGSIFVVVLFCVGWGGFLQWGGYLGRHAVLSPQCGGNHWLHPGGWQQPGGNSLFTVFSLFLWFNFSAGLCGVAAASELPVPSYHDLARWASCRMVWSGGFGNLALQVPWRPPESPRHGKDWFAGYFVVVVMVSFVVCVWVWGCFQLLLEFLQGSNL